MTPGKVLLELLMMQKLTSRLEPSIARDWLTLTLNRACVDAVEAISSPGAGLGCVSDVLWDIANLVSGELGLLATDLHTALNCEEDA